MNRRLRKSHVLFWVIIAPAAAIVLVSSWVARLRIEERLNETAARAEADR